MFGLAGVCVVFVMVFGGYLASGGKLTLILKSLPYELTMIGGAAIGAFVIGNSKESVLHTLKDIKKVFKGEKWREDGYIEVLCLLQSLIKLAKTDPVQLEMHIDSPEESNIFKSYTTISSDPSLVVLICDFLRSFLLTLDDPAQFEEMSRKRIERLEKDSLHSAHALQTMADGLPALGIVAAVLGVIKTMGSIDQPPEVLGKLIGGALVGTFLGVFLAYGIVGPFATRLQTVSKNDAILYYIVAEVLTAYLNESSASVCIEVGRQCIPAGERPDFSRLEEILLRSANE